MQQIRLKITCENADFCMHPEMATKTIFTFTLSKGQWSTKQTIYRHKEKAIITATRIDNTLIPQFIAAISKIKFSIPKEFEIGCDGGFTQIEYGDYSGCIMLRWWSCPPKEWKRLDEITRTLISQLNTLVRTPDARI